MSLPESLPKLPLSFARKFGVFCREHNEIVQLVYREDARAHHIAEARRYLDMDAPMEFLRMDSTGFDEAIEGIYAQDSNEAMQMVQGLGEGLDLDSLAEAVPEAEDLLSREDDAPIIRLINAVLNEAVKEKASDVHIETYEKKLTIRFRVDGILREAVQPRRELAPLLVSRIKVMAKLDIAERRIPQDGRISLKVAGREIDVRVSTMPANHGERVVLRLLDKQAGVMSLDALGMIDSELEKLRQCIKQSHGIFLVTGPTGSGKSTTLYAALSELNDHSRNILTIEDPIEYNLEGVGQSQVNPRTEMNFVRGLRAMLRQDPDVVMVGEVRDGETAEVAIQASLTGHLVLSTLHTNSAVGAVTRLQDMGIEPFLLSSSLLGVLAQRLVRKLCSECCEEHDAGSFELKFLNLSSEDGIRIKRAKGCEACNFSGYRGRTGIYELLTLDPALRELIHNKAGEAEITKAAEASTTTIKASGIQRILDGETSVEEVLRVTQNE